MGCVQVLSDGKATKDDSEGISALASSEDIKKERRGEASCLNPSGPSEEEQLHRVDRVQTSCTLQ